MKKTVLILLVFALTAIMLCGCAEEEGLGMEANGIYMDLPDELVDISGNSGYGENNFVYTSDDMAVFGSKGELTAEGVDSSLTLMDCAENALKMAEVEAEILTAEKGYLYFIYEARGGFSSFTNVAAFYQNGDTFWMIQISSKMPFYEEDEVFAILDSVTFL